MLNQRVGLLIALLVLAADQVSKWWILAVVMQPPAVIEVTPFLNIVLAWNRGISFGLFNGGGQGAATWPFIAVSLAIAVFLVIWLARAERRWTAAALGLLIGGAVGNVIDRFRFGAVVDFLDLHVGVYHWPAFNLADSAIVIGATFLFLETLFGGGGTPDKDLGGSETPDKGRG